MRLDFSLPSLLGGEMTSPLTILRNTFGFQDFRGVQEQVIGRVMAGEHSLAVMPNCQLRCRGDGSNCLGEN